MSEQKGPEMVSGGVSKAGGLYMLRTMDVVWLCLLMVAAGVCLHTIDVGTGNRWVFSIALLVNLSGAIASVRGRRARIISMEIVGERADSRRPSVADLYPHNDPPTTPRPTTPRPTTPPPSQGPTP